MGYLLISHFFPWTRSVPRIVDIVGVEKYMVPEDHRSKVLEATFKFLNQSP